MKIAVIAHGLSNGGAERVASIIANKLDDNKYDVLFIATYSNQKHYKLNENINYLFAGGNKKNKLIKLFDRNIRIKKELKKFNPDAVISFVINETIFSVNKYHFIYSLRNDPAHLLKSKFNRFLCNFCFKKAYKIVFQTEGARSFFKFLDDSKTTVIGNPIRDNLPIWNGIKSKTIMSACRLIKQKNIKMMIDGFAVFNKTHPDYKLMIYGEGEERNTLLEYISEKALINNVVLCGYSSNIEKIMSESNIFVLTSDFEGLSNSMLEALAIGIPSVVTDCPPGGAREYIVDKENGMLIPVGDYLELSRRLTLLAENQELQIEMSNKELNIRDRLSEDRIFRSWEKLLSR